MAKKKKLSIIDVAEISGVSRSTVSRVINNDPKASREAIAAVQKAMNKLGYEPPPMEKRYRRPSKKMQGINHSLVGLFFPDVDLNVGNTPLSAKIIKSASTALADRKMDLSLLYLKSEDRAPDAIYDEKVDGVIMRAGPVSHAVYRKLKKLPLVTILEQDDFTWGDNVLPDNFALGTMAAEWLLGKGCKKPVILYPDSHGAFFQRATSFASYLALKNIDLLKINISNQYDDWKNEIKQIKSMGIDGIFVCADDNYLINSCLSMSSLGIDFGNKIPTISNTNSETTIEGLGGKIANLDIRPAVLARVAVETLMWRLKNSQEPFRKILIAPKLVDIE
jgi:DNA-binding LacI/PurR family transcriptional regulator